jgi:DNA-binding NarL/FixJ family response regulator
MTFPVSTRPRLLIADDDPVVRSTLTMALDRRFEIIAVVPDTEQAVARCAELRPDAALVDVEMPGGGGLRAVREIAEVSPETATIMLSGDEDDGVVLDLLRAGAMSYCRKGGDPHELVRTIERSIRAHRALGSEPDAESA